LDQSASVPLSLAAYLIALAALSRRDPAQVAGPLAVFAVVLLAQESWRLGTRLSAPYALAAEVTPPVLKGADASLPNVYHLVLDAFEPDIFDRVWPANAPLDGFVYFTRTRSFFGATVPSMATVFASLLPTGADRLLEAAFAADQSLLRRLGAAGYRSVAYVPPNIYPPKIDAFDAVVWHTASLPRAEAASLHRWLFFRLWLATVAPAGLINRVSGRNAFGFGADEMRSLTNQRVSVLTQPVTTVLSFERYLEHETELPESGRYTLIHLLAPHNPFVLAEDCRHRDIRAATSEVDQSRCAVRLMQQFLGLLDRLGRLRGSLVLIHSDHGTITEPPGPSPKDYPALFLLKPPQATGPLRRVDEAVSLLDVTPTVLRLLGLEGSPLHQGRALMNPDPKLGP
jgi:hypothetical protein